MYSARVKMCPHTIHTFAIIKIKKHHTHTYGRKQGWGEGVESRQKWVFCEGGPCRIWRSGGFPKLSRKIFPLKPFFPPFYPLFSPLDPFLQFIFSSNASLQLFRPGQKSLSYPPKPSFSLHPS